ncbi:MAG: DUF2161 family putative PD-(D/E)XK-type phosphodiesterase [Firmicutes bacterium]|nr:DUF2161 family putative PD-(D/E)XK-type phosphodiesterase [Bacillota bacterium]
MATRETDLHDPIKGWLEAQGCAVRSEVKGIDMVGLYENELLVAIEMKLKLNLEVINQAVERQGIADLVYIAVAHDFKAVETKRFKMTLLTLKRLNLGLLLVNLRAEPPIVSLLVKPEAFDFEKSRKLKKNRKELVIQEFKKRSGDFNKAGSTKAKLMTAYREQCLLVAYLMHARGFAKSKEFEPYGVPSKVVGNILGRDFNGWFQRLSKGEYCISETGIKALEENAAVLAFLLKERGINDGRGLAE